MKIATQKSVALKATSTLRSTNGHSLAFALRLQNVILFMITFVILSPLVLHSQPIGPALDVPGNGTAFINIGKNDDWTQGQDLHALTFGPGNPSSNFGLWQISGSYLKTWYVGKVWNVPTGGNRCILVDSLARVGIGHYNPSYRFDVNGPLRCVDTILITSDRRYKRDIKPINNSDKLLNLNPVEYKPSGEGIRVRMERFKERHAGLSPNEFESALAEFESQIAAREASGATNYGFIAQELREIYPDLVSEDMDGLLSVNYIGLIPILVDAIKELKSEIADIKGESLRNGVAESTTTVAKLHQNNPNPFDTQTSIQYYIPSVAVNATICVYDMVGAEVLKVEIRGREAGSIVIDAGQLRAGMYMYALLVDGKEVDVKRMILTGK